MHWFHWKPQQNPFRKENLLDVSCCCDHNHLEEYQGMICVQRCRHLCYFWKGIATKNHAKWMIYRRLDWKNIGDASLRIPQRCYFLWFCLMMNSWLCIFVKIVWFCLRDNSFLHAGPQYKLSPNYIFLWFCLRVTSFVYVCCYHFSMLLETELIFENYRLEKHRWCKKTKCSKGLIFFDSAWEWAHFFNFVLEKHRRRKFWNPRRLLFVERRTYNELHIQRAAHTTSCTYNDMTVPHIQRAADGTEKTTKTWQK